MSAHPVPAETVRAPPAEIEGADPAAVILPTELVRRASA